MTPQKRKSHRPARRPSGIEGMSMEETRQHIFLAGRELLLAAQGALRFCQAYVEAEAPESSRPAMAAFFRRAIGLADELGRGIASVAALKRTAGEIAKPLLAAMDREMRSQISERPSAPCRARPAARVKSRPARRGGS